MNADTVIIGARFGGYTAALRLGNLGDIVTGMATVIEAMGAGKNAAMDIHEKLMGVKKPTDTNPEALPDDMECQLPPKRQEPTT